MDKLLVGLLGSAVANTFQSSTKLASAAIEPFRNVLDATNKLFEEGTEKAETKSTEERSVAERLDDSASSLKATISSLLEEHGITLKEPLELRRSPLDGQVEVFSDHPNRALIEGLINADSDIQHGFEQYANLLNRVQGNDDLKLTLPPNRPDLLIGRV